MMRKANGLKSVRDQKQRADNLRKVGEKLEAEQIKHISEQIGVFKEKLESFAQTHKDSINSDPVFRMHFQTMCRRIGVDPLASNKGFWAQTLGLGDFYYELAVQMIEICLRTRGENGGMISMGELLRRLRLKRGAKSTTITEYVYFLLCWAMSCLYPSISFL